VAREREKGERLQKFIEDYVAFDLETTSKYVGYAEIIEIGAIRVRNNKPVEEYATLIKPEFPIPEAVTAVNNITNEMVEDKPKINEVLGTFIDFVGDDVLLGHNITGFDMNIVYDYVEAIWGEKFRNDFIDTRYIAPQCLPDLENCRLDTLCEYFDVTLDGRHRALADAYMTHECYQNMRRLCQEKNIDISLVKASKSKRSARISGTPKYTDETKALQMLQGFLMGITADGKLTDEEIFSLKRWMDDNSHLAGNYPFDVVMTSLERVLEDGIITKTERDYLYELYVKYTAPVENAEHEEISDIEGVHCCITGDFNYGSRSEVVSLIEDRGGVWDSSVKKCTELLIVGAKGSAAWKQGNYGSKVKKALELKGKGQRIDIVAEEDFLKEIGI